LFVFILRIANFGQMPRELRDTRHMPLLGSNQGGTRGRIAGAFPGEPSAVTVPIIKKEFGSE
jgi:hypothetical protein